MNSTPPSGPVDGGAHLGRGLADVLGDQVPRGYLDQVARGQQPQLRVHRRDQPGDGRLRGARVAGEHHVPASVRRSGSRRRGGAGRPGLGHQQPHLVLDPASPISASISAIGSVGQLHLRVVASVVGTSSTRISCSDSSSSTTPSARIRRACRAMARSSRPIVTPRIGEPPSARLHQLRRPCPARRPAG